MAQPDPRRKERKTQSRAWRMPRRRAGECTGPLTCAASSPSFACTIKQAERNGDGPADQERSLNRSPPGDARQGSPGSGGRCFFSPGPAPFPAPGAWPHTQPKTAGERIGGPSERSPLSGCHCSALRLERFPEAPPSSRGFCCCCGLVFFFSLFDPAAESRAQPLSGATV